MISPTPGRIVWFTPSEGDTIVHHDKTKPLAAIVCHVWGDRMVNLMVVNSAGSPVPKTSVPLLQDDDPKPEGGFFASWMPYQLGQAKANTAA